MNLRFLSLAAATLLGGALGLSTLFSAERPFAAPPPNCVHTPFSTVTLGNTTIGQVTVVENNGYDSGGCFFTCSWDLTLTAANIPAGVRTVYVDDGCTSAAWTWSLSAGPYQLAAGAACNATCTFEVYYYAITNTGGPFKVVIGTFDLTCAACV